MTKIVKRQALVVRGSENRIEPQTTSQRNLAAERLIDRQCRMYEQRIRRAMKLGAHRVVDCLGGLSGALGQDLGYAAYSGAYLSIAKATARAAEAEAARAAGFETWEAMRSAGWTREN